MWKYMVSPSPYYSQILSGWISVPFIIGNASWSSHLIHVLTKHFKPSMDGCKARVIYMKQSRTAFAIELQLNNEGLSDNKDFINQHKKLWGRTLNIGNDGQGLLAKHVGRRRQMPVDFGTVCGRGWTLFLFPSSPHASLAPSLILSSVHHFCPHFWRVQQSPCRHLHKILQASSKPGQICTTN